MDLRAIVPACLAVLLSLSAGGCDSKPDAKADPKKADEKKADDKKAADVKVDEKKADEAKVDEKKADEAKVEEKKADEAKVEEKAEEKAEAKADDDDDDDDGDGDGDGDEGKADEKKADTKKPDEKKADTKADEKKADAPAGVDAKGLYDKKCKSCHGANGNGDTKIGKENDIEDWTVAGWKGKWPESKIVDIVRDGKSGTKMKPFKDKLSADEIAAVSKYARGLGK